MAADDGLQKPTEVNLRMLGQIYAVVKKLILLQCFREADETSPPEQQRF
jgi:hypothetical protein